MFTETITWHEIKADGPPDADTTVLVIIEGDPEARFAFLDGKVWRSADDALRFRDRVLRWAHLPGGERNSTHETKPEQGQRARSTPAPGALAATVGTKGGSR